MKDGHEQMTIHAETNAISDAAARKNIWINNLCDSFLLY